MSDTVLDLIAEGISHGARLDEGAFATFVSALRRIVGSHKSKRKAADRYAKKKSKLLKKKKLASWSQLQAERRRHKSKTIKRRPVIRRSRSPYKDPWRYWQSKDKKRGRR